MAKKRWKSTQKQNYKKLGTPGLEVQKLSMGTGKEPKDFTVGNTMGRSARQKYHSGCRIEFGLQGNKIGGEENKYEMSVKVQVRNIDTERATKKDQYNQQAFTKHLVFLVLYQGP